MTSDEIQEAKFECDDGAWECAKWLQEIAFQLAKRNENEHNEHEDNPRCFCPDCGADLGDFYSNRIRMEHYRRVR